MIKFVSDLRQTCGFLRILRFPPPIKLTAMRDITEILLRVVLNTINQPTNEPGIFQTRVTDLRPVLRTNCGFIPYHLQPVDASFGCVMCVCVCVEGVELAVVHSGVVVYCI